MRHKDKLVLDTLNIFVSKDLLKIATKVLLINGSPRSKGNTYIALSEVASALDGCGIETEIISIGAKAVLSEYCAYAA